MKSLYVIESGELTGMQMLASEEMLTLNTPPGHAWVDGALDQRRFVVQLVTDDHGTQQAVATPRTPPRPADSEMQTWSWSEDAGDWIATPTLAMLKAQARAQILAMFPPLDAALARPVGEITQAQALGEEPPAAAIQRLQAINADKQALRDRLAAIDSATAKAELDALLAQPLSLIVTT